MREEEEGKGCCPCCMHVWHHLPLHHLRVAPPAPAPGVAPAAQVLMDAATFAAIKERMEELGTVTEKGVTLRRFPALLPALYRLRKTLCGCFRCEPPACIPCGPAVLWPCCPVALLPCGP